jgi:hypothetical protein
MLTSVFKVGQKARKRPHTSSTIHNLSNMPRSHVQTLRPCPMWPSRLLRLPSPVVHDPTTRWPDPPSFKLPTQENMPSLSCGNQTTSCRDLGRQKHSQRTHQIWITLWLKPSSRYECQPKRERSTRSVAQNLQETDRPRAPILWARRSSSPSSRYRRA